MDNKSLEDEKRLFLIRSYIGNNESNKGIELISEQEANESIRAVAFLAMYYLRPDMLSSIMEQVMASLTESASPMLQVVAANLNLISGNIKEAADILSNPLSLEA